MLGSDWQKVIPAGTLQGGIEFLNALPWNISLEQQGGKWQVFSGESLLVAANSEAEREAFLFGMTIALVVLPDSILQEIKKLVAE